MTPELQFVNTLLEGRTRDNPLLREHIFDLTGLNERAVRKMFADARAQGVPIVSLSKGYYIAGKDDTLRYIRRERAKALTLRKYIT